MFQQQIVPTGSAFAGSHGHSGMIAGGSKVGM